jgi:mannose-6-phosphate isomerase-like protein (cupin superfamily)
MSTRGNQYEIGAADVRPWGRWAVVDAGPNFTVKRITVNPGGVLSLQMHYGRSEHWTIVVGRAEVTLGEKTFAVERNGSVYIPPQTKHRIANRTDGELVFVEVQCGERLDENDIVRFEDQYGRASKG